MPTYTYVCAGCGHRFDRMQSMTAKQLRKCPECSERKLERLIGPGAGLIFKGSGFYITDYRGGGAADAGKDEGTGDGGKKDKKDDSGSAGKNSPS